MWSAKAATHNPPYRRRVVRPSGNRVRWKEVPEAESTGKPATQGRWIRQREMGGRVRTVEGDAVDGAAGDAGAVAQLRAHLDLKGCVCVFVCVCM